MNIREAHPCHSERPARSVAAHRILARESGAGQAVARSTGGQADMTIRETLPCHSERRPHALEANTISAKESGGRPGGGSGSIFPRCHSAARSIGGIETS